MARKIKGYIFKERYRESDNAYDEYKAIRCYVQTYGEDNVKILNMCNQFGQSYKDIYIKTGAKTTGNYKGDIIAIRRIK